MSFYIPTHDMQMDRDTLYSHQQIAIEAISEYLKYIDVVINKTEYQLNSHAPYQLVIFCSCKAEDYKYFEKFSNINNQFKRPKVNHDSLYGSIYSAELNYNIFEYDTIYNFSFTMYMSNVENINKSFYMLKEATEELRYRKYSNSFDQEVLKELDCNN
jgi:hypothetical protein